MRIWQHAFLIAAMGGIVLFPLCKADAASVSGRASTVVEWFDDAQEDTATPLYQYLLLNVKDIADKGVNFKTYGRLADDPSNEVDIESRLYYAYLEKNSLLKNLDLKLGRQFISTTAGASLMDGLYLDYHDLGPYSIEFFGGGDVKYYEGYNAEDLIFGTEISRNIGNDINLGLSYLQKWDGGELAQELIGFDAEYDYRGVFSLYNETQYSWLSDEVTYFLTGFKFYRSPDWTFRTEYLYSLPVFSSTSIYSVFAVEEYQEATGELTYTLKPGLRSFARYTREIYAEYSDANLYEVGLEKIRTARFSGYLIGTFRDDEEGQDLRGFKVRAAYLFNGKLQVGAGAHVDVLERRIDDDDETTSSRIWADVTIYLNRKVNLQAKVERIESDLWDEYNRGLVRLNVAF